MSNMLQIQSGDFVADFPLPLETELTIIGDIKLPLKDVGKSLKFLEFFATFGKV